jgi:hypothetical protein
MDFAGAVIAEIKRQFNAWRTIFKMCIKITCW